MAFITKIDFSRQVKQYSGTTAFLSGSTNVNQNFSATTIYSGSTDLSSLIGSATNVQGGKNINTGGTVSDPVINLNNNVSLPVLSATTLNSTNFTGITVSATTFSADTIYGNSSNPYNYKGGDGIFVEGINGVPIINGNINGTGTIKGTNLSATTTIFSGSSNLDTLFVSKGGYKNVWIDANEMITSSYSIYSGATAKTTLGARDEYSGTSINTDNIILRCYSFTGGTFDQNVQFRFSMPDEWDLGTIKAKIYWDSEFGAAINDGVVWGIKAGTLSNDDSLSGETIFGTEVLITDQVIIPQDLHITSGSTLITIGGTPAIDDLIYFQISRKVNDTNDTLTKEARLFGTKLQYKELTTNVVQW